MTEPSTNTELSHLRKAVTDFNPNNLGHLSHKEHCAAWRKHKENEQRLAFLTGEVFYGIRIFSRSTGLADQIIVSGASREVTEQRFDGLAISLAKQGRAIRISHHSDQDCVSLTLAVGSSITFEIEDYNLQDDEEVTIQVFLTADQAEAWALRQKELSSLG